MPGRFPSLKFGHKTCSVKLYQKKKKKNSLIYNNQFLGHGRNFRDFKSWNKSWSIPLNI
jgi:hypothetical protein